MHYVVIVLALVFFGPGMLKGCESTSAKEARHQKELRQLEEAEARRRYFEHAKAEGQQALEQWDKAIRDEATSRRQRLEKASVKHTMSNKHGVRLDYYHLKSGKVVICTTSVPSVGAANFSCDGDL